MLGALENGDLEGIAARLGNVFEELLPPEFCEVFTIRRALLEAGALGAGMSGSGPTVFGIFRTEDAARRAAAILGTRWQETFLAKPVGKLS